MLPSFRNDAMKKVDRTRFVWSVGNARRKLNTKWRILNRYFPLFTIESASKSPGTFLTNGKFNFPSVFSVVMEFLQGVQSFFISVFHN